ncbi:hypothetical protein QYE76_050897 [Lolium multiflorum]|uniref:Transposase-associated domain-containing protein n=1 Tax=Lolium multiflorum TaxID=4521 RepID=A0AAD8WJN0_LOLMU|nr:hypothetical protein QYE76_050897 [Lolium multiflorum]
MEKLLILKKMGEKLQLLMKMEEKLLVPMKMEEKFLFLELNKLQCMLTVMIFREGVNSFLLVAEANKSKQGFMCCPCLKCKNEKDYSYSRDIKSHLLRFGFMSSYNVWTKHGEEGVMMEDGDEEEDNDDHYRSMFSECDDTAMDDNEEEGGEE